MLSQWNSASSGSHSSSELLSSSISIEEEILINLLEQAEKNLAECLDSTTIFSDAMRIKILTDTFCDLAHGKATYADCSDFLKIALLDTLNRHCDQIPPKTISKIMWSLARLGFTINKTSGDYHIDNDLLSSLLNTIYIYRNNISPKSCTKLLWSLAVLDINFESMKVVALLLLEKVVAEVKHNNSLNTYSDEGITQIKIFLAYYEKELIKEWYEPLMFLNNCVSNCINSMPLPISSKFHKEVAETLRKCHAPHFVNEYPIAGCYADIYFPQEEIVIEANGPTHYGKNGQFNPRSNFKERLFKKCGYKMISIHYEEWNRQSNKEEFIKKSMKSAGLHPTNEENTVFLITVSFSQSSTGFFSIESSVTSETKRLREETVDYDQDEPATKKRRYGQL